MKRFYLVTRDLHLYFGLFLSPFLLVFALSVVFLVHSWIPDGSSQRASRTAGGLAIPPELNLETRSATVSKRNTGIWDAMVFLHKMPGPHNANIRVNSFYMRLWKWFADAAAYLLLFIITSGIYLWAVLRAERRIGLALLAAGAFSFFGVVYALSH